MNALTRTALVALVASTASCSDRDLTLALEEPIHVHGAQFVEDALPGSRPLTLKEIGQGAEPKLPSTTPPATTRAYLRERLTATTFRGLATPGTVAIAVEIEGESSGYWLLPAGTPDPAQNNAVTWDFVADFQESLKPGLHSLLVAAIDEDGKSGSRNVTDLCINSLIPDNGNACSPETAPPFLIVGLRWDTPVDLDLLVVTPTGDIVRSKDPSTGPRKEDGSIDVNAPGAGTIDLDSNKDCAIDGRNQENLVFQTSPPKGRYLVYANLNRACGEASVHYEVALHTRQSEDDGKYSVRVRPRGEGDLIAEQQNGDTALGTFVTQFNVD